MTRIAAVTGAGITAIALTLTMGGCSSTTETESSSTYTTSAETTSAEPTSAEPTSAEDTTSTPQAGSGQTLDDYINDNNVAKTSVSRGDPGPTIDLPVPVGWETTKETPDASYGGIVYTQAVSKSDPPRIMADFFKLTGDVDPAKVLELAPTALKSIPGFESLGDSSEDELGGYQATQAGGSYTKDGNSRLVAQKTAVIPTAGGVFVLQLTADGLESDMQPLMEATSAIDKGTTITPEK